MDTMMHLQQRFRGSDRESRHRMVLGLNRQAAYQIDTGRAKKLLESIEF